MKNKRPYDLKKSFIYFKSYDGIEIKKLYNTTIKKGEYQVNSIVKLDDSDDMFIIREVEIKYACVVSVMRNANDTYTYNAIETNYELLNESDIYFDLDGNPDLTGETKNYALSINNYYAIYITVELDYEHRKNGIERDKECARLELICCRSFKTSLLMLFIVIVFRKNLGFMYNLIAYLFWFFLIVTFITAIYHVIKYKPYKHTKLVKMNY